MNNSKNASYKAEEAVMRQVDEEHAAYKPDEALCKPKKEKAAKKTKITGVVPPLKTKKPKLVFKNGDWVVVQWDDAPDELAHVVDRKPKKGAKYADLCFLRGKHTQVLGVNHDHIVAVVPTIGLKGFDLRIPDLVPHFGVSTRAQRA